MVKIFKLRQMTITKELQEKDTSLVVHNEGEWNKTTSEYTAFNDAGIECEVGEFLYGFLRVLKPEFVLETGTHVAVGASYLGMALKDNNKGHLDTVEFLPVIYVEAKRRIEKMGLQDFVECHFGDVKDFKIPEDWRGSNATIQETIGGDQPTIKYDFILLDTEPQTRFAEFIKFFPHLKEGGYIFIHDLHRHMHQIPNEEHGFAWPFGKIPAPISQLVLDGSVCVFHLPTPRGLTGFYKVSESDYNFNKYEK
ncbi:class I SAM-dependent methyltransferase [Patescibacteria group bacterium]|nr:class I SAM-dependent methyltransferase [Patescibacteria group bacterium]